MLLAVLGCIECNESVELKIAELAIVHVTDRLLVNFQELGLLAQHEDRLPRGRGNRTALMVRWLFRVPEAEFLGFVEKWFGLRLSLLEAAACAKEMYKDLQRLM